MLKINNVSCDWGEFKIKNIDLEIENGEYFVILGPSGAGKTMILELLAGLWHPDEGKIFMDDVDITNVSPEHRGVGFVYQDYMLFPHKSVFKNISFGLEMRKMDKKEIKVKVEEIMDKFNISHLSDRFPYNLSGGEQQRVAIARALIINPNILLMDEPLSALDQSTREDFIRELKQIHRSTDITIIQVTHNLDEALMLADRVAVIHDGQVEQVGNASEIFRCPANKFVADFVGIENVLYGNSEVINGISHVNTGKITIISSYNIEGKVNIAIRPEDILISNEKVNTSARNVFNGRIDEVIEKGSILKLSIDIGEKIMVLITHQAFSELELKLGNNVWVYFKASAVHLF